MIKLRQLPNWVYTNIIYDKALVRLPEIIRNIDQWESTGKIRYQFDISENIDIINKKNI